MREKYTIPYKKTKQSAFNKKQIALGFSLIELIVVLAIISILFVAVGVLFNPIAQIQKARNATRQQDVNQIKNALDTYFNDTGCYPTSIPFGSTWSSGASVYMKKIPQDPDCSSNVTGSCYEYETDGSSCPQWNILFAQMRQPVVSGIPPCVLSSAQNCLPAGGMSSYNYCAVSGKLDCNYISSNPIPTPTGSGGSGSGGSGATPTPLPTGVCTSPNVSACSNGVCNVKQPSQCLGCGGTQQCYPDLMCGGVKC